MNTHNQLTKEQQQGLRLLIEANGAEVAIDKNVVFALVGKGLAVATNKKGSSFKISTPGPLSVLAIGPNSGYPKTSFALHTAAILAERGATCWVAVEEQSRNHTNATTDHKVNHENDHIPSR